LFQVLRLDRETRDIPVLVCSSDLQEFERRASSLEDHSHVGAFLTSHSISTYSSRRFAKCSREPESLPSAGMGPAPS